MRIDWLEHFKYSGPQDFHDERGWDAGYRKLCHLGRTVKGRHANRQRKERLAARFGKLQMCALDPRATLEDGEDANGPLQGGLDGLFSSDD